MIGNDDDRGAIPKAEVREAVDQRAKGVVQVPDRVDELLGVDAVVVAGRVDLVEVHADERGPRCVRFREPLEHLIHARGRRHALVERPPGRRPHAADRRFRSRPEHRRRAAALPNRRSP